MNVFITLILGCSSVAVVFKWRSAVTAFELRLQHASNYSPLDNDYYSRLGLEKFPCLELTSEPLRRDVLQQRERYAEESDQQVADRQRANKNIRRRLDRPFLHYYVDDQTISSQSQDENDHVHDDKGDFGAVR